MARSRGSGVRRQQTFAPQHPTRCRPSRLILPVTPLAPMARASIAVVECESNLESDLVMRNLTAFYVAARLHHFEPANLSQRARCTPDGGMDGFLDALFRRARDLDDPVNMVRHRPSSVGQ